MKALTRISFFVVVVTFCCCKSATEVTNLGTGSLYEVTQILDTVQWMFVDFAKAKPGSSPGQIIVQTAEWVQTQPKVKDAYWFDSTYIEIEMESGLRTTFMITIAGPDSLSTYRGGGSGSGGGIVTAGKKTNNTIENNNILIYAPFVGKEYDDLYHDGELNKLVTTIKNSGKNLNVTLHENDQCTIKDIESFGQYGLVIINTHGVPNGFMTGEIVQGLSTEYDTNDVAIKENLEYQLGAGGYDKVLNGYFRFCFIGNLIAQRNWEQFITHKVSGGPSTYRILVNSEFIDALPPMPNTIILGNMCYSGWNIAGEVTHSAAIGKTNIDIPIKTAFTNKDLISYYSYGYPNSSSERLDNNFAKRMEDSLIRALLYDGDSTGNAYLNAAGQEYTAKQLNLPLPVSPDMPMKHSGHDDYSYNDCIDTLTDERDGQKYKTVCIGDQIWMAENLRYNAPGSKCYDDNTSNCAIYGRLYDWNTLMQGAAATAAKPSGVKGICPKGWHVPSHAEWLELIEASGGGPNGVDAGGALKSTDTLWKSPNKGATNSSGFSTLPGGVYVTGSSSFQRLRENAMFWSATAWTLPEYRYDIRLHHSVTTVVGGGVTPEDYESCRCVQDK